MEKEKSSKVTSLLKVAAVPASAYIIMTATGMDVHAETITPKEADTPVIVETTDNSAPQEIIPEDQNEITEIPEETTPPKTETEIPEEETELPNDEIQTPPEVTESETPETTTPEESTDNVVAPTNDATSTETTEVAEEPETEEDEYRLQYHFSNEKGWSNDPNGMVYYNGQWHLFFQYYPDGVNHGSMSWGHAVSDDLIHWTELGISDTFNAALYEDGTRFHFSGSAVWDINNTSGFFNDSENGGLVAIWTIAGSPEGGSFAQRQAIAYSTDGIHWIEPDLGIERVFIDKDGNPVEMNDLQKDYYKNVILGDYHAPRVIVNDDGTVSYVSDDPLNSGDFRDPKVFWHEESQQWIMVVAGGPLRIYSSPDLINWKAEAMQDDIITECPELYYLPIEGTDEYRYVLSEGGRWYQIGDLEQVDGVWTFVADTGADGTAARYEMNFAPDAYAAQSFNDMINHRTIMVQWMSNWSYADNTTVDGEVLEGIRKVLGEEHNGQFTLFSELSLVQTPDGLRLQQKPIAEYDSIKNATFTFNDVVLDENTDILDGFNSQQFQMEVEFTPEKGTEEVVIEVLKNTEYETKVIYNVQNQTLTVDRSNSMAADKAPADHMQNGTWFKFLYPYSAKVPMEDGKVKLHIFVDNYSIEVYANDYTTVLTELVFPDKDATGMTIYATGTPVHANIAFSTMDSYRNTNIDMRGLSATMQDVYNILSQGNSGYSDASFALLQDTYNKAFALVFSQDASNENVALAQKALSSALAGLQPAAGQETSQPEQTVVQTGTPSGNYATAAISTSKVDTSASNGLFATFIGSIASLFGIVSLLRKRKEH